MKIGLENPNATNIVILGIPVVGILAALGLTVSYFRKYRKSPTMLVLGYITIVVTSFVLGGLIGLSQMRTEHLAFLFSTDCTTERMLIEGTAIIDVMQESIATTTPMRLVIVESVCDRLTGDVDSLRTLPHVYVTDGFRRLIEIHEYSNP